MDSIGFIGGFRDVVTQMGQFGVFDVLLPLVFVFTLVFAILEKINIFQNKGVSLVLSLIIAFFTISNAYISGFFMYLFSNLGLGIAILLVLVILLGFGLNEQTGAWKYIFGIVGGALFLVVLGRSGTFSMLFGPNFSFWLQQNAAWIIMILVVGLAIVGVYLAVGRTNTAGGHGGGHP
ncbi:hypothetical protein J4465_00730 [Candidatus Pacearchaeota archaeon]|nr:hypothetical protein [Candidatus Pacearchaeota archaeon]